MNKQPLTLDKQTRRERLLFACAQAGLTAPQILNDDLSDPHNGGQRAALFACDGKTYIYKPRTGAADHAWADFLEEIAPLIDAPLPRAIRPLTPADAEHTIVPCVKGREAADEAQARLYYRRFGALLALCAVLGATDLHSENLIADGDSPLLVDVETLLAGVTPDRAGRGMYDVLLCTHLLPNWMLRDGENVDVSGLSGAGRNQLLMNGAVCPAHEYAGDVEDGFAAAYAGILAHRDAVGRALERFAKAPFRKLLRPTDLYDRLCRRIEALPTQEEKEACAALMKRAYARSGEAWAKKMERVCDSEMQALLRGDIPYFYSLGGERCLRDMDGIAAQEYFALSPLEAARERLAALDERHGRAQRRVIRQSLEATRPLGGGERNMTPQAIFEMIEAHAIDGCPSVFMGVRTGARGEAYFQSIGFDLYEGLLGVLGFYGALYEATGDGRVLEAIRAHYGAYRAQYILPERKLRPTAASICLTSGAGGHIMLMGYLSRATGDVTLLDDAAKLLSRFDFSGFSDFEISDVYSGACGLLTALPLLKGRGMDEALAAIASQLAEGVLRAETGLTGYAHGAAGVALALGAAQVVGGGDYTQEILRLLEWENARYDETAHNWPDLRDPQRSGFMKGLCSGAPGIGLARAQLLRYTQDARIAAICERDMLRVRAFLSAQEKPLRRDTLCCGNAALLEAQRVLCGDGTVRLNDAPVLYHPLETSDFAAGLFQGWAGVGYALARQLPGAKQSLFVWEVKA